ncbi:MAG: endolytic transglycosylase MltG [Acidimicrobiales bacterium]
MSDRWTAPEPDVEDPLSPVVVRRPGSQWSRPQRRRIHPLLLGLMVGLVVILIAAGIATLYIRSQVSPGGKLGPKVTVTIPHGATTSKIGTLLANAGVIHAGGLFRYWTDFEGAGPYLPGTYHLAKNESYSRVAKALRAGPPLIVDKLVIPEGFTLSQIAARVAALPGMHLSASVFLSASSSGEVRSAYEPPGINDLEGLAFPATYTVTQGETEVDILQQMVSTFDQYAAQVNLLAAASALHTSAYDVVTVASIIQGEAKLAGDFPPVASAIYNRLADHMVLGDDSTLIYALRQSNPNLDPTTVNLQQPNPYNTRLNQGLPPSPIDSPGLVALQAAANPPTTNYLYFVEINQDGQLGFASTESGFASLQAQCRAAGLGC